MASLQVTLIFLFFFSFKIPIFIIGSPNSASKQKRERLPVILFVKLYSLCLAPNLDLLGTFSWLRICGTCERSHHFSPSPEGRESWSQFPRNLSLLPLLLLLPLLTYLAPVSRLLLQDGLVVGGRLLMAGFEKQPEFVWSVLSCTDYQTSPGIQSNDFLSVGLTEHSLLLHCPSLVS